MNYFFSEDELAFNASLDAWELLLQMGFNENSLYREGSTIRLFCPLHKDQIRRSMIIYTDRNTYKCQYTNCEGHKGGNLLEFYSGYMGVEIAEVMGRIRNQGSSGVDLVERADKMIQEGNLVDALPLLQKAVQLDPTYETTRCRLGALYLELGDKEAGYREYMTAAEHFGVRGELDKTLNIYNILVIITPDDIKVRKQLSYLFSRLKRQDEAVQQLKWVVDRHIRKGELGEGASICRKMIELCPEYPDSHRILGEILLKQGSRFEAVEELRTAAAHYVRENNLKKAKETVDLGLRYTPGDVGMKDMRGKIEKLLEIQASSPEMKDAREQEYERWLGDLKTSIGLVPAAPATAIPPAAAAPAAAAARPPMGPGANIVQAPVRRSDTPTPVDVRSAAPPVVPAAFAPMPKVNILPDDPRIGWCRQTLQGRTPDQLKSLHDHLVTMFEDVQKGFKEGFLSEFETNVVREFYAAFCLAMDAYRASTDDSGQYKAAMIQNQH